MEKFKEEKTEEAVYQYLRAKQMFCFRRTIIRDLIEEGNKKTNIQNTLRKMRREKKIVLGMRRWGFPLK